MHILCLFLALSLLFLQLDALLTNHNYNYSQAHELALIAQPLFLPTRPVPAAQQPANIPTLLDYCQLKKYQLRDTSYRAQQMELAQDDQQLLFQMEPLHTIFQQELIHIENYRLLEMRKFKVSMRNPSRRLKIVVNQVTSDRSQVKRDDQRGALPLALHPQAVHDFNFIFHAHWLNPQFLQATIYFIVQIYDGSQLAQEKVYARKVSATITPNHLRLQNHVFDNCPRYHVVTLKNYEHFPITLILEGKKRFETVQGVQLEGQTVLEPTKQLKVLVEGKSTQLLVHTLTDGSNPTFPALLLHIICIESVSIDYFNIGILPDQKSVFEFPVTVTSTRHDNATIEQVVLESSSQTVIFEALPGQTVIVGPKRQNMQIGIMRIYAKKEPQKKSTIIIKAKIQAGHDTFWTQQRFLYQQIRNPISAGVRRFVDLRKPVHRKQRFLLKNNINVPLFLTRFYCDDNILQLSWTGQRRKVVYPNQNIQELSFLYVGPKDIPLSPQRHTVLLEFNGNLMVPLEVVVYDMTLQCLLDNQLQRCSDINSIDFGYFRDQKSKVRQLIVRNWNPESIPLKIQLPQKQCKQHGITLKTDIYGPLPHDGAEHDKNKKDHMLKGNHFVVLSIEVELLPNGSSLTAPINLITSIESIPIFLIIRVQNGTIALIPQVVKFQIPIDRTIEYLNLVSTYSQKYRIQKVVTNCSNVIVAVPPHQDLQGNQFVGMTVVYEPYLAETNNTEGDWRPQFHQLNYYLHRLRREYEPVVYAQITLTTTTQLEAKSTVIIDRNYRPLIPDSIQKDQGIRYVKVVLVKRKPKSHRVGQTRQVYELSLKIRNPFPFAIKYKPLLVSEQRHTMMDTYFNQYRICMENRLETVFFCISETIKAKNRLNPSAIRQIFQLHYQPDEYYLDVHPDEHGETQITMRPKNPKNKTINVIPRTIDFDFLLLLDRQGYRTCYYFAQHQLIALLLLTQLPYKILEEEGGRTFRDFFKAELNNLHHLSFFQTESDLQIKLKSKYMSQCYDSTGFLIYRFCDTLHSRVSSVVQNGHKVTETGDGSFVIGAHHNQTLTLQLSNPTDKTKMYLVMANNFTKYQTYEVEAQIKMPSLFVRHDYLSPIQTDQDLWRGRSASLLPIDLYPQDYHQPTAVIQGMRQFQLVNQGEGPITIDHIGIDSKYYSCSYKGIQVLGLTCVEDQHRPPQQIIKKVHEEKFNIAPLARYNLTVRFFFQLKNWPQGKRSLEVHNSEHLTYTVYLYDEKGYYFKLDIVFRVADHSLAQSIAEHTASVNSHKMYAYFFISGLSFVLICIFLLRIRDEDSNPYIKVVQEREKGQDDQYKRLYRLRRLGRLLKEPNSYDALSLMGARLNKRAPQRPVHKVTQDLILSAKEVTQRQLRNYFNESQQSAIGAILEINHHLSLSESISQEDKQQPSEPISINTPAEQLFEEESSNLPQGEQVDLTDQMDEDSWYDFNKQTLNNSRDRSSRNIDPVLEEPEREDEEEFYNVFRTGLRKSPLITLNLPQGKKKLE